MFRQNSYFDDPMKRFQDRMIEGAFEGQRESASPIEQIHSWANDISDSLSIVSNVDVGKYGSRAYADAMQRIDEIVHEMDDYGSR